MKKLSIQKAGFIAILSLTTAVLPITQLALATSISDLKDVPYTDPKAGIYLDLIKDNALTLDKKGQFRPDEPINKAAFYKASLSYLGYTPSKTFNFYTGYSDVPEESWFAPYVKKALEIGAINNKIGDQFQPDSQLSRQDGLILAMNIYGLSKPFSTPKSDNLFKDIRTTHPLAYVYAAAIKHGIYFENSQEYFYPSKILTRGDAADLLFKAKLAAQIEAGAPSVSTPHYDNNISTEGLTNEEIELLQNQKFAILLDAWSKINKSYIYTDKVDQDQLIYQAISGMVDSLDDPYSVFRSPNADGQSYIYIPENYEGIGAIIENIDGKYVVQTTINNSPADRADLRSKDIIIEIEGQNVQDLTMDQVMALIKGKTGTKLHIKVKRDSQTLSFEIVREKISIESMHYELLPGNINYLRIDQFTEEGVTEFNTYLEKITSSNSKKLIIDLRNNPGGYLTTTQTILGHFLTSSQTAFFTMDKSGDQTSFGSAGSAELKDYKIVVLINEGSASAAEIMAGALQDYKLGYLIGTTTFGKGSVQEITSYDDNSSLKLTIAKWLTPLKRDINHKGINPDKEVKITEEQRQMSVDPQLETAKEYLK